MFDYTEFEPVILFFFPIIKRVSITTAELSLIIDSLPRITTSKG